jgi:hypothetical protein
MRDAIELAAAAIAVIAGVIAAVGWAWGRLMWTRRVTNPEDRDLDDAFTLYGRRIPDVRVRESSDDIRRWLQEIREAEAAGKAEWRDCLVIAKCGTRVSGFFYAELHLVTGLLFVSGIAIEERDASKRVLQRILRRVVRESRRRGGRFSGMAFELEAPEVDEREEWLARYRLFKREAGKAGVVVKRVCISFDQPRLSLWDSALAEKPLYLFYGRVGGGELGDTVSKAEVAALLDTLLNHWYASAFEGEPDRDAQYRAYVRAHYERTVAVLPDEVPLSERVRPTTFGSQAEYHKTLEHP